jgi:hypothetical protein
MNNVNEIHMFVINGCTFKARPLEKDLASLQRIPLVSQKDISHLKNEPTTY